MRRLIGNGYFLVADWSKMYEILHPITDSFKVLLGVKIVISKVGLNLNPPSSKRLI